MNQLELANISILKDKNMITKEIERIEKPFNEKFNQTLMKDYKEDSNFDEVLDRIIEILGISLSDEDRNYITCIDVSYPETWEVDIV